MSLSVLSRRALLTGAGATISSAAFAIPVMAIARQELSAREHIDALAAELKAAIEAHDPSIKSWLGPTLTNNGEFGAFTMLALRS